MSQNFTPVSSGARLSDQVAEQLSADQRHLLVHCFHLEDAAATVAQIKRDYETPLREIFP